MDREKLKTRVKKLLALSHSPNEHEAAAAAEQAQALITKHKLSENELDEIEMGEMKFHPILVTRDEKPKQWRCVLMSAVAEANQCHCVIGSIGNGSAMAYGVVGTKESAAICEVLFNSLLVQVDRLAAHQMDWRTAQWTDSYRLGVVDMISIRLHHATTRARNDAAPQGGSSSSALVRLDQETQRAREAAEAMAAEEIGSNELEDVDVFARAMGVSAGRQIDIGGKSLEGDVQARAPSHGDETLAPRKGLNTRPPWLD